MPDRRDYLYWSRRPLVLYGAGAEGLIYADYLRCCSIGFDAFCDADPAKRGKRLFGVAIVAPESLPRQYSGANVVITANKRHTAEIEARLEGLGFPKERVFTDITRFVNLTYKTVDASVEKNGDLARCCRYFADEESRRLFRTRYRHWMLGDRPENPDINDREVSGVPFFSDAEALCEEMERLGWLLAFREFAVEFDNDDMPSSSRIVAAAIYNYPEAFFHLRAGSGKNRTRFFMTTESSRHVI